MTFDTFTAILEVFALLLLFATSVWCAVQDFRRRHGYFACDELPMQHPRLTPEVPRVRLCPFDQDATS